MSIPSIFKLVHHASSSSMWSNVIDTSNDHILGSSGTPLVVLV